MYRFWYFVIVGQYIWMIHDCYAFTKSCNYTQLLERGIDPELQRQIMNAAYFPRVRDVSYLPEEDYVESHELRQDGRVLDRDDRNLMPEYRNLCEIVTKRVHHSDSEYEYQPPHYHEIYCKSYSLLTGGESTPNSPKQKCAHPGFHCVQRSRTIFMVRRRWDSECWEPFTKEIASGCDCMWPVSVLGDITGHY